MQQTIMPMPASEGMEIRSKVMLLYLMDRMKTPMTFSLISQFAVENNYLNHYNTQLFLDEMVKVGFIEKLVDENAHAIHYDVAKDGETALEAYYSLITPVLKEQIAKFVSENRNSAKREFEIIATYFYDSNNNEYLVKCVAYEDDIPLIELSLSVVTKEQALYICNNWKNNIDTIYGEILRVLTEKKKK